MSAVCLIRELCCVSIRYEFLRRKTVGLFYGKFSVFICKSFIISRFFDSVRPHRRQPTRLHRPGDSPGKNTGVGCHFHTLCMPPPARGAGTLIPSAQRLGWAAKQPLVNAALGALFA